jgi:hypothetical protein
MMNWGNIQSNKDIELLMQTYGGFHDSCIKGLSYVSGAGVTEDRTMFFGEEKDRQLSVIFQRQWEPISLEILFIGVRKMCIAGWQSNYGCDIFDCHLAFHHDLITGLDDELLVWADDQSFNPKGNFERNGLAQPMVSYIIAQKAKWRVLSYGASDDA